MKLVIMGAGVLVLLIAAVSVAGLLMAKGHRASRAIRLTLPPEAVWAVLLDHSAMPGWRPELVAIERVADIDGHEAWKETTGHGVLIVETVLADPPRRLVTRIHDPRKNFGGTWTFEMTRTPVGTELRITEDGEVYNPIFRVVSGFLDQRKTMTTYLTGLAHKLEDPVVFED